jgi:c(7)-type cytochrome triheme protein
MKPTLKTFAVAACFLIFAAGSGARERVPPQTYGRVIIGNHSAGAGLAPVVFDHWLHRARYTCRLCHVDIGFSMKAGATNITAATNRQGFHCGACHDGKRRYDGKIIFASCTESPVGKEALCDRCHAWRKNIAHENDFKAFAEKLPKDVFGNGISWEAAEKSGQVRPLDFLEGVSLKRPALKAQKDVSIEANVTWISDVVFSHKKHAVWNGCEVCHPDIFPIKRGEKKYTMLEIDEGEYCGVCHGKVAFPLASCEKCHTRPTF